MRALMPNFGWRLLGCAVIVAGRVLSGALDMFPPVDAAHPWP